MSKDEKNEIKIRFDITQEGAHNLMALFRERGVSEEEIEKCFPRLRHMWVEKYDGSGDSGSTKVEAEES